MVTLLPSFCCGHVNAGPGESEQGTLVADVALEGHSNPPGHRPGRCTQDGFAGDRDHASEPTGLVRNSQGVSGYELRTGTVVVNYTDLPHRFGVEEGFVVQFVVWRTGLANNDPFDVVGQTLS